MRSGAGRVDRRGHRRYQASRPTAIAAAGASLLTCPPCRLDLNPIEQPFARRKALLKAATRTMGQLWSTNGHVPDSCPPAECHHYLRPVAMVPRDVKML